MFSVVFILENCFMTKRIIYSLMGLLMIMSMLACGKTKYNVEFDGYGFKSDKKSYEAGEKVTVTYDMVATDTNYNFYTDSDDVKLQQEFDGSHGYVFTFTMPAHNVKMYVKSKNSMTMDPIANNPWPSITSSPEDCIKDDNIKFDYYDATVATDGGKEYDELVLYDYTAEQMVLVHYHKEEDQDETKEFCMVPASVLDECMKVTDKYQMDSWGGGSGLEGRVYVVKFLVNGSLIRVSSDNMPKDGEAAFDEVAQILWKVWREGKDSLQTETWFCPECGTKNDMKYCSTCGYKKPE